MSNNEVTVEMAEKAGLTPGEFGKIREILGRTPDFTELYIFSALWSEEISLLPDAGHTDMKFVDIGDRLVCAVLAGSYNCQCAGEPGRNPARVISGTSMEISALGARPVARLNSLHFGDIRESSEKSLIKDIVNDTAVSSNILGIPAAGGEVYFDKSNNARHFVNTMYVGILEKEEVIPDTAGNNAGNPVYIAGCGMEKSSRDPDGSKNLSKTYSHFMEKLLLEATTELLRTGVVTCIKDIGNSGIIGSLSEVSVKTGQGMNIDLDKIPLNDKNKKPHELLLSCTPGRMLVVIEKGKEKVCEDIFSKWDLNFAVVGEVITEDDLRIYLNKDLIAEIPAFSLVLESGKQLNEPELKEPDYIKEIEKFSIDNIPEPEDLREVASVLVENPNNASKKWIYRQYNTMTGLNDIGANMDTDAGIIMLKGTDKALALTCDSNSRYVLADAETGAAITVAEAARNIICSGGRPVAFTTCLNFGSPDDPEVRWQLAGAVKGIAEASRKFEIPVASSNVNLQKEKRAGSDAGLMYPAPVIGMLGIIDQRSKLMSLAFKRKGEMIYLIGRSKNDIASSEYLVSCCNIRHSPPPYFDPDIEFSLHQVVKELIDKDLIVSAHDVSCGGLFITLIESCIPNNLGFDITSDAEIRKDAFLFGESQSRIVVSVDPEHETEFLDLMIDKKFSFSTLGHVTKGELRVDDMSFGYIKDIKIEYESAPEKYMNND